MEDKSIKVSVIVASYNYEKLIKETLDSLINQTYKNFEVIVIDDGSSDNSVEVIKEYCKKDNRVHLYTHPHNKNQGLCFSLMLALSKATGDYIAFCESDDYWDIHHLEEKVDFILNSPNDISLLVNDLHLIGYPQQKLKEEVNISREFLREHTGKNIFQSLRTINHILTFSCVMVKKELLEQCNFIAPIDAWLDFWLWKQISIKNKLYYIDKKLTFWRIHPNSYNFGNDYDHTKFAQDSELFFKQENTNAYLAYKKQHLILSSIKELFYLAKTLVSKLSFSFYAGLTVFKNLSNNYFVFRNTRKAIKQSILKEFNRNESCNAKQSVDIMEKKVQLEGYFDSLDKTDQFKILVVLPELSLSDPSLIALNLVESIRELYNISPVILSLNKGSLRDEFTKRNFLVLDVDRNFITHNFLEKISPIFDLVILNSWCCELLGGYRKSIPFKIWWTHDDFLYASKVSSNYSLIRNVSSTVTEVWGGSSSAINALNKICPNTIKSLMFYGLPFVKAEETPSSQVTFLLHKSTMSFQGISVFLKAIKNLAQSVKEKAQFIIIGDGLDFSLCDEMINYIRTDLSIITIDSSQISFKELMNYYMLSDCIVTPMQTSSMPISVVYGFMLKKLCIISESIDAIKLGENNRDFLSFENGNFNQLSEILANTIKNLETYKPIAKNGQRIYETYFSSDIFKTNLKNKLDNYIHIKLSPH